MALADDKWVRVMCDFSADGIWASDGAPAEPEELPVSTGLKQRLSEWQDWYEREADTPYDSGLFDVASFAAEGLAIAKAVKAELPDWTVLYHDEAKGAAAYGSNDPNLPRSEYEYEV